MKCFSVVTDLKQLNLYYRFQLKVSTHLSFWCSLLIINNSFLKLSSCPSLLSKKNYNLCQRKFQRNFLSFFLFIFFVVDSSSSFIKSSFSFPLMSLQIVCFSASRRDEKCNQLHAEMLSVQKRNVLAVASRMRKDGMWRLHRMMT